MNDNTELRQRMKEHEAAFHACRVAYLKAQISTLNKLETNHVPDTLSSDDGNGGHHETDEQGPLSNAL